MVYRVRTRKHRGRATTPAVRRLLRNRTLSGLALNLVLLLVGAVLSVLIGLKWRFIRYSAAAILIAPQVVHSALQKHWLVVGVMIPFMVIVTLVDIVRARRAPKKNET